MSRTCNRVQIRHAYRWVSICACMHDRERMHAYLYTICVQTCLQIIDACMQADVLVCARGGGGLLRDRMALVSQLWSAGIKAEVYARWKQPSSDF